MISLVIGGVQGSASDIEIQASETLYLKNRPNQVLAEAIGQPLEWIEQDTDRDSLPGEGAGAALGLWVCGLEQRLGMMPEPLPARGDGPRQRVLRKR